VQGELIKAAEKIFNSSVEIGGAGRTDAGVHAIRQTAHLRSRVNPMQESRLKIELNDLLPHDINILSVKSAPFRFHARHDAIARCYLYQISTRRTAFGKSYVWWIKDRLNAESMKEACSLIVGKHDFRSFCEAPSQQKTTETEVKEARIEVAGSLILFRISAGFFLWKMVRRLVGTIVEVGRGNLHMDDFEWMLLNYAKEPAAWTAPPSGLFLEKAVYTEDDFPTELAPAIPIV
jgi:tRNA pseudouridine38-40 synthase